jgi:pyruvate/2-oxoglutarate dehydrogenase complex dihydrolipoamide dehydrogenase (E3) component
VAGLGLEAVGGPDSGGPIAVDASLQATAVPGGRPYAVGDVNGRNMLTRMGQYQARVCADVIAARAGGEAAVPARTASYSSPMSARLWRSSAISGSPSGRTRSSRSTVSRSSTRASPYRPSRR